VGEREPGAAERGYRGVGEREPGRAGRELAGNLRERPTAPTGVEREKARAYLECLGYF